jgi:hypothetical protein
MKEDFMHIEMISPISYTHSPLSGEMVAQFEAVSDDKDGVYTKNVIITMPLHEDFFDFAKEYCRQYRIHIEEKLK